ncbi:MAG: hypothetical protein IT355_05205 [Gemmatimonadaceae bacterium]|nr:hypothetical protein [Gemmatimonadaceae bacterium]
MSIVAPREPAWRDVVLWFETIDAIVRGLGHALNNRALALSATIEALDARRPVGEQVAGGLTREAERLTEQLRQLRSLPFALEREAMPLLLRDVIASAVQLHRSHATLGEVPVYLEGSADAPPVLVPESAMLHAILVTLTALKGYAAPDGLVRISYAGTAEVAEVTFLAQRDPADEGSGRPATELVRPTALAAALLSGAHLQIDQRIGVLASAVTWSLPSLRAMRRLAKAAAATG